MKKEFQCHANNKSENPKTFQLGKKRNVVYAIIRRLQILVDNINLTPEPAAKAS